MQNVNRILSQIIQISIIQNEHIKYNTEHFYLVDKRTTWKYMYKNDVCDD